MIQEVVKNLPILVALIVANIAAGTVNSMAVEKINFDKSKLINGVAKAIIAIVSVFALTYAFDAIDLSGLGYTPMTIISTGIITYAGKLGVNLIKIVGLESVIKAVNPLSKNAE